MNLQPYSERFAGTQSQANFPKSGNTYSRPLILSLLNAALLSQEYRFSRQVSLQWLACYPGDLQISLIYAQALLGESSHQSAIPILKGLCQADPEYLEAVDILAGALKIYPSQTKAKELGTGIFNYKSDPQVNEIELIQNWIHALDNSESPNHPPQINIPKTPEAWGRRLSKVRKNLGSRTLETTEHDILSIIGENPNTPLVAVTHLAVLDANPDTPLQAKRALAEHYHRQWPDCLACTLYLSAWLMEESVTSHAVCLLHEVASRDVGAQVATRIWGEQFPYFSLWPTHMEISLDGQVPATVASALGWNRLGFPTDPVFSDESATSPSDSDNSLQPTDPTQNSLSGENVLAAGAIDQAGDPSNDPSLLPGVIAAAFIRPDLQQGTTPVVKNSENALIQREQLDRKAVEEILVMKAELDRLAKGINRPDLVQLDGRYPVYIIFTLRSKLVARFGLQLTADLEKEMDLLAKTMMARTKPGQSVRWGARVFFADQAESTKPLGLAPARSLDPWGLKLALADLDAALAKRGEMIGALLIVGGPEIVPFHHLPNPVDDQDRDIPSDNPYATRDDNYFIPEWPVGRLPDGGEGNPQLLMNSIHRIRERYTIPSSYSHKLPRQWLDRFLSWSRSIRRVNPTGFGYTAAIWRLASLSVYQPVGDPRSVLVSPPLAVNGHGPNGKLNGNLPKAKLGYFNLHGLADGGDWYGQRDPLAPDDGPDYPVALRPQDIQTVSDTIPMIVFTEACYGLNIQDKSIDQAIALQFLASGSLAVAGSTCMSYGSIVPPLIGADFLGYSFWKFIKEGIPAGEALRRAKIQVANDMHQRQGYLDGEDQKTLISFLLFGDPLAQLPSTTPYSKSVQRLASVPKDIQTVCDRASMANCDEPVPAEITSYVKQLVSNYLPGMSDAELTYTAEKVSCKANGHVCPTSQFHTKANPSQNRGRHLVTLSKQVAGSQRAHLQVARLTLDASGKLVKMAVSR
jgi:hypothetical protein